MLSLVVAAKIRKSDGRRAPVVFRNPSASDEREGLVAQFRPGKELVLLSVPEELETEAAVLWRFIVEHCGNLGRRKTTDRSGHGPVYEFLRLPDQSKTVKTRLTGAAPDVDEE